MSDRNVTVEFGWWSLIFPLFIALKFTSAYVATWSWWWLLMPIVPVMAAVLHRWPL